MSSSVFPSLPNALGKGRAGKPRPSPGPDKVEATKVRPAPTQPGKNPTPDEHDAICSRNGLPRIRKRPVG